MTKSDGLVKVLQNKGSSPWSYIPSEKSPQPLTQMKELIAERTGTKKDSVGAYFRLNPKVSDLPEKYWLKTDGVKLLVLGNVTQAGSGCACPEGTFLKALLTYTILQRQEVVLVDLAAGVEFMGRASVQGVDALVVVVEPGLRSIESAINIARMANELGIRHIAAIINKVTEARQVEAIKAQLTDVPVLATIDYLGAMVQADLSRTSVIKASTQLVEQLAQARDQLSHLVDRNTKANS